MTWFQLIDAKHSDPEPRRRAKLVPNSALFFNPSLALEPADGAPPRASGPRLRLVKGTRIEAPELPSAA